MKQNAKVIGTTAEPLVRSKYVEVLRPVSERARRGSSTSPNYGHRKAEPTVSVIEDSVGTCSIRGNLVIEGNTSATTGPIGTSAVQGHPTHIDVPALQSERYGVKIDACVTGRVI